VATGNGLSASQLRQVRARSFPFGRCSVFGATLLKLWPVIWVTCKHASIIGYRNAPQIRLFNRGKFSYGGLHDLRIISARSGNAVGVCRGDRCPSQIWSAMIARACWRGPSAGRAGAWESPFAVGGVRFLTLIGYLTVRARPVACLSQSQTYRAPLAGC
jgi:hypothetical protein